MGPPAERGLQRRDRVVRRRHRHPVDTVALTERVEVMLALLERLSILSAGGSSLGVDRKLVGGRNKPVSAGRRQLRAGPIKLSV